MGRLSAMVILSLSVGASGCFFAIRRRLYEDAFPVSLSRDFASALIAREHGYRSVSVDEALCYVPRTTYRLQLNGDFTLDAAADVTSVCEFYGLPAPQGGPATLGEWVARSLGRPPIVGDTIALGPATLSVRAMDGPAIKAVGLKLGEE